MNNIKKKFEQVLKYTKNDYDLALNTVLVIEGSIRDAFLYEPRNYKKDWNIKDDNTINVILEDYNDILSTVYIYEQGILVYNKKKFDFNQLGRRIEKNIYNPDNDNISSILKLQCDLSEAKEKDIEYVYHINIMVNDKCKGSILTSICANKEKDYAFNKIVKDVNDFIIKNLYKSKKIRVKKEIKEVISDDFILTKLKSKDNLEENIKEQLLISLKLYHGVLDNENYEFVEKNIDNPSIRIVIIMFLEYAIRNFYKIITDSVLSNNQAGELIEEEYNWFNDVLNYLRNNN